MGTKDPERFTYQTTQRHKPLYRDLVSLMPWCITPVNLALRINARNWSLVLHVRSMALHVRVNFRESYWEYLATMFTRESKSWRAGSLWELWEQRNCETSQSTKFSLTRASEHLFVWEQEHGGGSVSWLWTGGNEVRKFTNVQPLIRHGSLSGSKARAAVYIALRMKVKKKKCRVKDWVKRRYPLGAHTQLVSELQLEDAQQFWNFTRMSAVEVQSLVNMMGPIIGKQYTCMRNACSAEERVIVTLCSLATGK